MGYLPRLYGCSEQPGEGLPIGGRASGWRRVLVLLRATWGECVRLSFLVEGYNLLVKALFCNLEIYLDSKFILPCKFDERKSATA